MRYFLLPLFFLLAVPALANDAPKASAGQLLAALSDAEQDYHVLVMDYAMEYMQPGQAYQWESHGGKGSITPGEPFISKSKANCRPFQEILTIAGQSAEREAVACKRAGGTGWCELEKNDVLTCALEKPALASGIPSLGGGSGSTGAQASGGSAGSKSTGGNSSANIHAPAAPNAPQRPKGDGSGAEVADTVTGTAGRAAGPATGGAIQWFNETFR